MISIPVLILSLLVFSEPAAQSRSVPLGDAARKARASQETQPAVRTYTEDDLPRLRLLPINVIGEPREESEEESSSSREQENAEHSWRFEFARARRNVADAEARVANLERVFRDRASEAALLMDWAYITCGTKSDVIFGFGYSGVEQLNSLCATINEARRHLAEAKQHLADLPDELRRAGGYPGWGRE